MSNQAKWYYNDLKKASELTDRELNAAIGWLAREGNIEFEEEKSSGKDVFFLSLNVYY
ncbi:winged helix-turn-helix domain-containing protein [Bacteroides caecigallinarum]|uniref:winged helix-turn-helix domain-containing protein n=1 Tax=Bacteroides caecigallinarum TaxID=1411144 RepID=UPI00195B68DF|nr:winged helix-turn-helix domain-containing protein [Bacteroides caecigallinarum]